MGDHLRQGFDEGIRYIYLIRGIIRKFRNTYLSQLKWVDNFYHYFNSSRGASLLRQDSTRSFQKLLRMFLNALAALGTEPADVLLQ